MCFSDWKQGWMFFSTVKINEKLFVFKHRLLKHWVERKFLALDIAMCLPCGLLCLQLLKDACFQLLCYCGRMLSRVTDQMTDEPHLQVSRSRALLLYDFTQHLVSSELSRMHCSETTFNDGYQNVSNFSGQHVLLPGVWHSSIPFELYLVLYDWSTPPLFVLYLES